MHAHDASVEPLHDVVVMRGEQYSLAGISEGAQYLNHYVGIALVQAVGRFVQNKQVRIHRHAAGNRHTLFFTARQTVWRPLPHPIQAEQRHHVIDSALYFGIRQPHLQRTERNLLFHRRAEQLGVGALEHESDALMQRFGEQAVLRLDFLANHRSTAKPILA